MLERCDVGDVSLLFCSYCFHLIYAKTLKTQEKENPNLVTWSKDTFSEVSSPPPLLVIEVTFLVFPSWLVGLGCSVSCLDASGKPSATPRRQEGVLRSGSAYSPGSCWIEETFQKECRFEELQLGVADVKILGCLFIYKSLYRQGKETLN